MDRKGKQKLKRYFIVYVIFAVFFTVGMYLITKYEENAKATQIALLLAEHPELEGEIVAIWEKSGTVDYYRRFHSSERSPERSCKDSDLSLHAFL